MSKQFLNHWFLLAAAAGVACAMDTTGCGGSSSDTTPTGAPDASADSATDGNVSSDDSGNQTTDAPTGTMDSGGNPDDANPGDSSATPETGSPVDGGSACVDGTPCTNGSGNGICSGGTCGTCASGGTSAGPDTACTAAYGGGTTPYVCSAGSCIAGNCNVNGDCKTAGMPTCTSNVCGGCTTDSQCGSGTICDTNASDTATFGTCVSSMCAITTSTVTACAANAADVCCAGSCVPGNCCYPAANAVGITACRTASAPNNTCAPTTTGETTGGGICTACAAAAGSKYYVDPDQGSDVTGTGNNAALATCAFRSITRALQVIGSSPVAGTLIELVNSSGSGSAIVSSAEKFPIVLPKNVTLTTSGTGAVTIRVPAAVAKGTSEGIILSGTSTAIAGAAGAPLTIDGQSKAATVGVVVQSASARLANVTIQNFAADGILVGNVGSTASALTVNEGVQSNGNGQQGLAIGGASTATISGSASSPTTFNNNGQHGIDVRGTAAVTVNGAIGATPPTGSTVVASGNGLAGVWIQQTAGGANNKLTGMVCTASGGNGLRLVPGSNVTVRSGWFLGNAGNGIAIENAQGSASTAISAIDLGTATQAGANVVQDVPGGHVNGGAGICLNLPKANVVLNARGNVFGGATGNTTPINCAAGAAKLHATASFSCDHADVGGTNLVAPDGGAMTSNAIDVAQCTY